MMPLASIRESHRIGRPARSAARAAATKPTAKAMSRARSTMPQAWIMRTATGASASLKGDRSASARMMAKERAVMASPSRR